MLKNSMLVLAALTCVSVAACQKGEGDKSFPGVGPRPDVLPVMLNKDLPFRYPPSLYAKKVQANVMLRVFIDKEGQIVSESTHVAESSGFPPLDSAAVKGSNDLRFIPAKTRGEPVPVSILFPVYFRHPEAPRFRVTLFSKNRSDTDRLRQLMATVERNRRPYDNVVETIGWTPLIRLHAVTRGIRTPVYAKAEFFNPGGSIKDRIAVPIIEKAEREGKLKPGGTIVEGTSGNTGTALAIAAALRGYKCIFTMPDKMSQEKVRLLKAFGAEVIITPTAVPPDHPDSYVMMAKRIAKETPNAILADQFYNDANPQAHYDVTGPELWEQTEGRITHFVAAAGTGGTITGVGRYLKEKNPNIRIVAGDPVGSILADYWRSDGKVVREGVPYKIEGIGQDKIPGTLDMSVIDDFETVPDKDAFAMARRLTREEGLFVGGSSGLIAQVALRVAREVNDPNAFVVTVLCDTGERYLSKLYSDEWMRENQMLDSTRVTLMDVLGRKEIETPAIVGTAPGSTVRQALGLMALHDISQLPVMEDQNCVGSVSDWSLSQKSLENPKLLDATVSEVMDSPFPMISGDQPVDSVVKMLSKSSPAVLVRSNGTINGIVTRSDMLHYMMSR